MASNTTDTSGLVERMRRVSASMTGDYDGEFDSWATLVDEAADHITTLTARLSDKDAEIARLWEGFSGAIISETVAFGQWSLTLHFGKGEQGCVKMRAAADLIRALEAKPTDHMNQMYAAELAAAVKRGETA